MNFIFISPNFPETYRFFCMRLRENGVNVLGIGDALYNELHPELTNALTEYYRVTSLENYDEVYRAVAYFAYRYGKIDWLESNNEYWLEQDAALRTDFNITSGLKSDEIQKYKSKILMKQYYQKAGVPAARYLPVTTLEAALAFTQEVGYPVVVKPDNGVGALATYKLTNDEELALFFEQLPDTLYVMEEYVPGRVTTFDGICDRDGNVLFASSHISVNSIMDMVNEKVPTYYYVDKEVPEDVRSAGERTLRAFGASSRFFHLEFFRLTEDKPGLGNAGDIVALEVNMRPAGGFTPDMLNFAGSVDVYQIWADMIAYNECRHTYHGPRQYCIYCGRRDEFTYIHNGLSIRQTYADALRLVTRMPDALAGTMGNQVYIACFDDLSQVEAFARFCFEEA